MIWNNIDRHLLSIVPLFGPPEENLTLFFDNETKKMRNQSSIELIISPAVDFDCQTKEKQEKQQQQQDVTFRHGLKGLTSVSMTSSSKRPTDHR